MHRLVTFLAVLVLVAAVAAGTESPPAAQPAVSSARAAGADEDRRAIAGLEHEWLERASDRDTLERILADDFQHPVSAGVILTKQQHIDWSVKHPRPSGHRAEFELLQVRLLSSDTAVASGIVVDVDASGASSRRTVFSDVFVRRHGRWQAVEACETPVMP